mmetsp:Transcript_47088/g.89919  ORF Transcript_47088/g.89919 Transcript_47088/m.89919 type:complete len:300 (+) Transcript_47088:1000-1899(+)
MRRCCKLRHRSKPWPGACTTCSSTAISPCRSWKRWRRISKRVHAIFSSAATAARRSSSYAASHPRAAATSSNWSRRCTAAWYTRSVRASINCGVWRDSTGGSGGGTTGSPFSSSSGAGSSASSVSGSMPSSRSRSSSASRSSRAFSSAAALILFSFSMSLVAISTASSTWSATSSAMHPSRSCITCCSTHTRLEGTMAASIAFSKQRRRWYRSEGNISCFSSTWPTRSATAITEPFHVLGLGGGGGGASSAAPFPFFGSIFLDAECSMSAASTVVAATPSSTPVASLYSLWNMLYTSGW